ncbi:hypothetical protein L0B53_08210 [Vibrio sp. SS-MA-C1-2]|uniref:protein-disulfide reductase DsbD domain-containing protein n=1 Tax=Vibrio sp. SS-MA-C1-2 TaxID=2908646 RepID=UPI001F3146F6|nr:protein-disulfide reductase DsbD domain-containing protein [Vibrio sp. SS-MA-C1-2]UJF19496.1 hypothetical protein L0B53_08210 [Vibrio sp. SS-MA-C1-2]
MLNTKSPIRTGLITVLSITAILLFISSNLNANPILNKSTKLNHQVRFLPASEAFIIDFKQQNHSKLNIRWQIKPGYYLYKEKIKVIVNNQTIEYFTLPEGITHQDPYFGIVDIYKDSLAIDIPIADIKQKSITIHYQGCAEAGLCYPPEKKVIPIKIISHG